MTNGELSSTKLTLLVWKGRSSSISAQTTDSALAAIRPPPSQHSLGGSASSPAAYTPGGPADSVSCSTNNSTSTPPARKPTRGPDLFEDLHVNFWRPPDCRPDLTLSSVFKATPRKTVQEVNIGAPREEEIIYIDPSEVFAAQAMGYNLDGVPELSLTVSEPQWLHIVTLSVQVPATLLSLNFLFEIGNCVLTSRAQYLDSFGYSSIVVALARKGNHFY
ncbi:hypothetical protein GYMLUDRAFT_64957 [Collybiopsis luxurians FD-317 M1]|uniref:Uncharacterized protein n=1 Tax=Collybiopsis luxurians FD-317 M1 TaxID=944289 RepID=A0A0D0C8S9_9AGAR|nr:hypothetical protein GYMLUDRAFT_64957 [Collybiopsis luxurians FD-317 M1]